MTSRRTLPNHPKRHDFGVEVRLDVDRYLSGKGNDHSGAVDLKKFVGVKIVPGDVKVILECLASGEANEYV